MKTKIIKGRPQPVCVQEVEQVEEVLKRAQYKRSRFIVLREPHKPRALKIHAFYISLAHCDVEGAFAQEGRIADTTPVSLTFRVWCIAKQKCVHSHRERGVGKDSWGGFSISWCWRL